MLQETKKDHKHHMNQFKDGAGLWKACNGLEPYQTSRNCLGFVLFQTVLCLVMKLSGRHEICEHAWQARVATNFQSLKCLTWRLSAWNLWYLIFLIPYEENFNETNEPSIVSRVEKLEGTLLEKCSSAKRLVRKVSWLKVCVIKKFSRRV